MGRSRRSQIESAEGDFVRWSPWGFPDVGQLGQGRVRAPDRRREGDFRRILEKTATQNPPGGVYSDGVY